jgi:hypothetical protein
MKKAKLFLAVTLFEVVALAGCLYFMRAGSDMVDPGEGAARAELVRTLGLSDLAIWTEARYTRHPSQADFFSAFQDFPAALEHFPAGSVVSPPTHLWLEESTETTTAPE